MQEHLAPLPVFWNCKASSIGSDRIVVVGNVRRIGSEGIVGVGINRDSISLELPIAGDNNIIPLARVIAILAEVDRTVGRLSDPVEFPGAVERLIKG